MQQHSIILKYVDVLLLSLIVNEPTVLMSSADAKITKYNDQAHRLFNKYDTLANLIAPSYRSQMLGSYRAIVENMDRSLTVVGPWYSVYDTADIVAILPTSQLNVTVREYFYVTIQAMYVFFCIFFVFFCIFLYFFIISASVFYANVSTELNQYVNIIDVFEAPTILGVSSRYIASDTVCNQEFLAPNHK